MPLFEVAILQKPTKKEAENGTGEKLLYFSKEPLIARDKETAGLMVMRAKDIPEFDLNTADLIIRPFA